MVVMITTEPRANKRERRTRLASMLDKREMRGGDSECVPVEIKT